MRTHALDNILNYAAVTAFPGLYRYQKQLHEARGNHFGLINMKVVTIIIVKSACAQKETKYSSESRSNRNLLATNKSRVYSYECMLRSTGVIVIK